jgi:hypothetical protein
VLATGHRPDWSSLLGALAATAALILVGVLVAGVIGRRRDRPAGGPDGRRRRRADAPTRLVGVAA